MTPIYIQPDVPGAKRAQTKSWRKVHTLPSFIYIVYRPRLKGKLLDTKQAFHVHDYHHGRFGLFSQLVGKFNSLDAARNAAQTWQQLLAREGVAPSCSRDGNGQG